MIPDKAVLAVCKSVAPVAVNPVMDTFAAHIYISALSIKVA